MVQSIPPFQDSATLLCSMCNSDLFNVSEDIIIETHMTSKDLYLSVCLANLWTLKTVTWTCCLVLCLSSILTRPKLFQIYNSNTSSTVWGHSDFRLPPLYAAFVNGVAVRNSSEFIHTVMEYFADSVTWQCSNASKQECGWKNKE